MGTDDGVAVLSVDVDMLADKIAARVRAQDAGDTRTVAQALDAIERDLMPMKKMGPRYRMEHARAFRATRELLGDVRICDLTASHATALWTALARPASNYSRVVRPRFLEADQSLDFRGLARFAQRLPKNVQSNRREIEVTPELHRAALEAIRWAWKSTNHSVPVLRALEVGLRSASLREAELAGLEVAWVNLRSRFVRLPSSKVGPRPAALSTKSCDILRQQIQEIPFDSKFVWPSESSSGHLLPESLCAAWKAIREGYTHGARSRTMLTLRDLWFHDLRRCLATRAQDEGVVALDVTSALGHRDQRTIQRYTCPAIEGAHRAIDTVESVLDATIGEKSAGKPKRRMRA